MLFPILEIPQACSVPDHAREAAKSSGPTMGTELA